MTDMTPAAANAQTPVFQLQRVYLKDASLEMPGAPMIFLETDSPKVDVQLEVSDAPVVDVTHEVIRQALVALGLTVAQRVAAAAQRPAPEPRHPRLPSGGGFSPFRQKGFPGTSFGAAALEQPGCPLAAVVTGLNRSERGVTLAMQVINLGETDNVDVNIRPTVMPDDVIIVAVQEATGGGAAPWRRDQKDLEREVREAVDQARQGQR